MKKTILLAFSVFLLSLMTVTSAAQSRTVGVTVGDWFKYSDIRVNWSSNDPNATLPLVREWLKEMNETKWFLLSVKNVSGAIISFQTVKHFKDGSEKTENGNVSVYAGTGHMPAIMIGISVTISANLNENDTIYASPHFSDWKINETVTKTYAGGGRETNHLNMTWESTWTINSTLYETIYYFEDFYWDRRTGILVEYSFEEIMRVGEYLTTLSMSYRIVESNVWIVSEFPMWTLTLFVFIVISVAIVIFYWCVKMTTKRKKNL